MNTNTKQHRTNAPEKSAKSPNDRVKSNQTKTHTEKRNKPGMPTKDTTTVQHKPRKVESTWEKSKETEEKPPPEKKNAKSSAASVLKQRDISQLAAGLQADVQAVNTSRPVTLCPPRSSADLLRIRRSGLISRFLETCKIQKYFCAAIVAATFSHQVCRVSNVVRELDQSAMLSVFHFLVSIGSWTSFGDLLGLVMELKISLNLDGFIEVAVKQCGKKRTARWVAYQLLARCESPTTAMCVVRIAKEDNLSDVLKRIIPSHVVEMIVERAVKTPACFYVLRDMIALGLVDMLRLRIRCRCGCKRTVPVFNTVVNSYLNKRAVKLKEEHAKMLSFAVQAGLAPTSQTLDGCKRLGRCRPSELRSTPLVMAALKIDLRTTRFLYQTGATSNKELWNLHTYFARLEQSSASYRCESCKRREAETLAFVHEAATSPRRLEDLCVLTVSQGIGCRPERLTAVRQLEVAGHIKDKVIFTEAAAEFHGIESSATFNSWLMTL